MCVVSMIMDHYRDEWGRRIPQPQPYWPQPPLVPYVPIVPDTPEEQAEKLQKFLKREPAITDDEIREFRKLLERAREYDQRNNEPDCEMDEKRQALLDIAKQLGVEINFL